MSTAPVILFVYSRPDHTAATLRALAANRLASDTDLIIFADGPKHAGHAAGVVAARAVARAAVGFASVTLHESTVNKGLAASIIGGVSQVFETHDRVIVVEDDIVTAPGFLDYLNQALTAYQRNSRVFAACGYSYPPSLVPLPSDYSDDVYLSRRPAPWGWATWRDRWAQVDWSVATYARFMRDSAARARFEEGGWDMTGQLRAQMEGRIDSWALRFSYAKLCADAFTVLPTAALAANIGNDGTGVHCFATNQYDVALAETAQSWVFPPDIAPDPRIMRAFHTAFRPPLPQQLKAFARRQVRRLVPATPRG